MNRSPYFDWLFFIFTTIRVSHIYILAVHFQNHSPQPLTLKRRHTRSWRKLCSTLLVVFMPRIHTLFKESTSASPGFPAAAGHSRINPCGARPRRRRSGSPRSADSTASASGTASPWSPYQLPARRAPAADRPPRGDARTPSTYARAPPWWWHRGRWPARALTAHLVWQLEGENHTHSQKLSWGIRSTERVNQSVQCATA